MRFRVSVNTVAVELPDVRSHTLLVSVASDGEALDVVKAHLDVALKPAAARNPLNAGDEFKATVGDVAVPAIVTLGSELVTETTPAHPGPHVGSARPEN